MAVNLWVPFTVSLDASGNGTQGVGAPSMGQNWQGYITFAQAPSGQSFTVSVSGQTVAYGNRQSGPFAAGSGQMVTVTVSGGPAGTTVNGVVQGVINQGVAAQAALPASGSLIEVSGGTVNIEGGKITIEAGQNGVNVSTDTPPVPEGPLVGNGAFAASVTATPPAGATGALIVLYTAAADLTVQSITAVGQTSGANYAGNNLGALAITSAVPVYVRVPGSFEAIDFAINTKTGTSSGVDYAQLVWLFNSDLPNITNDLSTPANVRGAQATLLANEVGAPTNVDQIVVGTEAAAVMTGPAGTIPAHADQVVQGYQGQSGASVQTVLEAPANYVAGSIASLAAGGSETIIAAVAGKTIRLRDVYVWGIPASGNAVFEISSTVSSINNLLCGPPPAFFHMDFKGATTVFPADTPFVFANSGSETTSYTYLVLYDLD